MFKNTFASVKIVGEIQEMILVKGKIMAHLVGERSFQLEKRHMKVIWIVPVFGVCVLLGVYTLF